VIASVTQSSPWAARLGQIERIAERTLRVEHGANILPIGHLLCFFSLLGWCLSRSGPRAPWLAVPAVVLLTLLNFSVTIGVLHMHAHRPLFVVDRLNRLTDLACCFPSWLTATEMRVLHVAHHHRFDNGEKDVTSTVGREVGARAIGYWVRYAWTVKAWSTSRVSAAEAPAVWRRRGRQMALDLAVVASVVVVLTVRNPSRMALFYWVPLTVTLVTTGYFAWLTHAPAEGRTGGNASINNVSNLLNFFIFNQGFHSVHHRFPGIHWTEIPDRLPSMRDVDPDVIVGYWVTLNSAWRLAVPHRFRDPEHGLRWKQRLDRRLTVGPCRSKALPYFVRV
jgi:sn-1 stearoyl-lipid 9-desaturase